MPMAGGGLLMVNVSDMMEPFSDEEGNYWCCLQDFAFFDVLTIISPSPRQAFLFLAEITCRCLPRPMPRPPFLFLAESLVAHYLATLQG